LALEIERKEGFYPFGWVLRLSGIVWVGGRAADFELLGEDGLTVVVEVEKALRKESADSLLDFRGVGLDEAVAKRIARGLELIGS
jgi:hypothetical protein